MVWDGFGAGSKRQLSRAVDVRAPIAVTWTVPIWHPGVLPEYVVVADIQQTGLAELSRL